MIKCPSCYFIPFFLKTFLKWRCHCHILNSKFFNILYWECVPVEKYPYPLSFTTLQHDCTELKERLTIGLIKIALKAGNTKLGEPAPAWAFHCSFFSKKKT